MNDWTNQYYFKNSIKTINFIINPKFEKKERIGGLEGGGSSFQTGFHPCLKGRVRI